MSELSSWLEGDQLVIEIKGAHLWRGLRPVKEYLGLITFENEIAESWVGDVRVTDEGLMYTCIRLDLTEKPSLPRTHIFPLNAEQEKDVFAALKVSKELARSRIWRSILDPYGTLEREFGLDSSIPLTLMSGDPHFEVHVPISFDTMSKEERKLHVVD